MNSSIFFRMFNWSHNVDFWWFKMMSNERVIKRVILSHFLQKLWQMLNTWHPQKYSLFCSGGNFFFPFRVKLLKSFIFKVENSLQYYFLSECLLTEILYFFNKKVQLISPTVHNWSLRLFCCKVVTTFWFYFFTFFHLKWMNEYFSASYFSS